MKWAFFYTVVLLPVICVMVKDVKAQPFTLDKKIKPVRLDAEKDPEYEGVKITGSRGKTDTAGSYFYVKGLNVFQPIDVMLLSEQADIPLNLEIYKSNWEKLEKKEVTDKEGLAQVKFRTYGEFGIKIKGDGKEVPYTLVVVGGKAIRPPLPSPFVAASNAAGKKLLNQKKGESPPPSKEKDPGPGGLSSTLLILLGAVALLLAVIVVLLLRKKGKGPIGLYSLLLFSGLLFALPAGAQSGRAFVRDLGRIWEATGGHEKLRGLVEKARKKRDEGTKAIKDGKDVYDWLYGEGCAVSVSPPGMPQMPSFCTFNPDGDEDGEGDAAQEDDIEDDGEDSGNTESDCVSCFMDSRTEFNNVRYFLAELQTIYSCTKEMSKKAIAFGDNASGVHAVTGIVWHQQRDKITASIKELEKAYDSKYAELLERLRQSMLKMSECEQRFGTPDWYDRFGYIYYEFMKDKYKRSD